MTDELEKTLLDALEKIAEWPHSGVTEYQKGEHDPSGYYAHAYYLMGAEIAKARDIARDALAQHEQRTTKDLGGDPPCKECTSPHQCWLDGCVEQLTAAQQVSTAERRFAPSQEGVGQGEVADAAAPMIEEQPDGARISIDPADEGVASIKASVPPTPTPETVAMGYGGHFDTALMVCRDLWPKYVEVVRQRDEARRETLENSLVLAKQTSEVLDRAEKAEAELAEERRERSRQLAQLYSDCGIEQAPNASVADLLKELATRLEKSTTEIDALQKRLDEAGEELPPRPQRGTDFVTTWVEYSNAIRTAATAQIAALKAKVEELQADAFAECAKIVRARADREYCIGMELLKRDACLGEDIKLERGVFTKIELNAHREAAQHMGAHYIGHEMAKEIDRASTAAIDAAKGEEK